MVQRALESSRANALKSGDVNFEWSPQDMGKMRFEFVTQDSSVQVKIIADRPYVVDLIEQTREVVEKMIADQGLKLEKLDVFLRDSTQDENRADSKHDESKNAQQPRNETSSLTGRPDSIDNEPETSEGRKRHLTGERQWTA
jgi:hypothetical protein